MGDPFKLVLVNIILSILLILGIIAYRFIFKKKVNFLYILVIISILPLVSLARPGTYEAGDLTLHSVFLQSFYENLKDGIFLPQWAGGLCAGYGCPVFLFEYVMPFYIGSLIHILGFSYLDSMKLFLAFSFILSGITMYIFLKDEHDETSSFVGSLLYLFAPIHLIEMHFRVSVGTHVAFLFIPLAFLFAKKSLEGKLRYIIFGAINFLFFILSHSSIAFVIIPGTIVYAFIKKKNLKQMIYPILSLLLGVGLTAYYALPAMFELKHTWYFQTIRGVGDFRPFFEYIYSMAGFGLLFQGKNGETRFIVGYSHLFIVAFSLFILFKKKIHKKQMTVVNFLLLFFLICFVLMQSFTKILWDNIFFLRSFVFPMRMLVPISFIISYLGAIVTGDWNKKILIIFCTFIVFSTILNWGNRKMVPENQNAYNTHGSLYTEYFEPNNKFYIKRYNERIARLPELVLQRSKSHLEVLSGKGEIKEITRTQISHEYIVHAEADLKLSENTYYFPGWKVFVNGKEISPDFKNRKKIGVLIFSIPKGLYYIRAEFKDTSIRMIGRYISLVFASFILTLILFQQVKRYKI